MQRLMIRTMQGLIMRFDYAKINKRILDWDVIMVKLIIRAIMWL